MRRVAAAWVVACGVVAPLLGTLASGAGPEPLPARSTALPAYGGLHEAAFGALETLETEAHWLPEIAGGSVYFTRDQMLAVLARLHRAETFPNASQPILEHAGRIWDAAQVAWQETGRFYDVVLTSRANCIQLEANAWALWAADRLANATGRNDVRVRADLVAESLRSAVAQGSANGVRRCPAGGEPAAGQWPLPLLVLLWHAEATGSLASRDAAVERLRAEIDAHWTPHGFRDPSGPHLLLTNAQYLLALQVGVRIGFGTEFESNRDTLADFLLNRTLSTESGHLVARSVETRDGRTFTFVGSVDPTAQAWAAAALHAQRKIRPLPAAGESVPERLLATLAAQHWGADGGGFRAGDGAVNTALNAYAALFTRSARVATSTAEPARLAFVVPAEPSFRYPPPGPGDAARFLLLNEWTYRFTLETNEPLPQTVLLPLRRVGPIELNFPPSKYSPAPQLSSAGQNVPATTVAGVHPLLQFVLDANAAPPLYRIDAYAPVRPVQSEAHRTLQVAVASNATGPLRIGSLTLELAFRNVTVSGVALNDKPLAANEVATTAVGATEFLPQPHVRLELRNVDLRPGPSNTITVSYSDPEAPRIHSVWLGRDEVGSSLEPVTPHQVYRAGPSASSYVRAEVSDNAALRGVFLVTGQGPNQTETRMAAIPGEPRVYFAPLPVVPVGEPVPVSIRALDEHDNLELAPPFFIEAHSLFFREGNVVLLVFSGVLFFSAAAIYAKMVRRQRD